jgi:hypothetical protein
MTDECLAITLFPCLAFCGGVASQILFGLDAGVGLVQVQAEIESKYVRNVWDLTFRPGCFGKFVVRSPGTRPRRCRR